MIDHKGYSKAEWPTAVTRLQAELRLSQEDEAALLNAGLREEGKAQHFREKNSGNRMTIEYIAYHTVCHDDKIDVVYGKHEESMEVSGEVTALLSQNCIQYNGTLFAVWPQASPHSKRLGTEMGGMLLPALPSGWKVVNSTQEDFDSIRKWVIAPYGWDVDEVLTHGPCGNLQRWNTANYDPPGVSRGTWSDRPDIKKNGEFHFKFKNGDTARFLIQACPAAKHELVNDWKRYVKLSAQREWSQGLGTIRGGPEQGNAIFHG